jgi:small-conductance mechanosensitive channel
MALGHTTLLIDRHFMEQSSNYFSNIGDVTAASLKTVWFNFLQYLPKILGAIIVLVIGWIIASLLGSLVKRIVQATGVDGVVERSGLNTRFNFSPKHPLLSGAIGALVKWLIIIATFIAVAGILELPQLTDFLNQVLTYIPRAIVAIAILTIGMLAAEFVANLVTRSLHASELPVKNKQLLGSLAKYAIVVFSVIAALTQLNIVPQLIQIAFGGLVLALALAFGLGGRDEAARVLARIRSEQ